MSDINKEIESYHKQIEDPENYTNERWIEKVAKDYPKLNFKLEYYSFESDYSGISEFQNGKYSNKHEDSL